MEHRLFLESSIHQPSTLSELKVGARFFKTMGVRLRKPLLSMAVIVAALSVAAGGFYSYLHLTENFHEVERGVLYRSAQMSGAQIERVAETYGIHSILNLRGANHGKDWYYEEIAAAKSKGIVHYDFDISARRFVAPNEAEQIIVIIRNAPKPILIHCKDGADRTGLVAALFRFSRGASREEANGELSLRYGHFPYLWSKTKAMDESFAAYVISVAKRQ